MRSIPIIPALFFALGGCSMNCLADDGYTPMNPIVIPSAGKAARFLDSMTVSSLGNSENDFSIDSTARDSTFARTSIATENEYLIELYPNKGSKGRYRIEQWCETTMGISAEGPHRELYSWKHGRPYIGALKSRNPHAFFSESNSCDRDPAFPEVSKEEIIAAVRREFLGDPDLAKNWVPLAEQCQDAVSLPCFVAVSRIFFKVSVRKSKSWNHVHTLVLTVPIGC